MSDQVVANGHRWPCTRFYALSSGRDRCTCVTALPLEPHTEAEEATLKRIEGAEPAEESAVEKAAEERRAARRAQETWDRRRVEDYAAVVGVELTLTPGDDLMRAVDQLYRAALAAAAQPTNGRTGE